MAKELLVLSIVNGLCCPYQLVRKIKRNTLQFPLVTSSDTAALKILETKSKTKDETNPLRWGTCLTCRPIQVWRRPQELHSDGGEVVHKRIEKWWYTRVAPNALVCFKQEVSLPVRRIMSILKMKI